MQLQKPEHYGEATQCCWCTLWLQYRIYTSHATVYIELMWPLLSSNNFFSFHLGFNICFKANHTPNGKKMVP